MIRAFDAVNIIKIRSIIPCLLQNGRETVSVIIIIRFYYLFNWNVLNFQFHQKHQNFRHFSKLIEKTALSQKLHILKSSNCLINANCNIKRVSTTSKDLTDKKTPTEQLIIIPEEKVLEIKTKGGNLIVRTTVSGTTVDNVVIEKEGTVAVPIVVLEATVKPPMTEKEIIAEKNKELAKKRIRVNFALSSMERNFITPARAMSDFLLKLGDLEALPRTKRRSPYEQEPPITVYWRKDVEAKAIEIWGSRDNLLKECLKRELEKKRHQQNVFTMKRRLRDYRREMGSRTKPLEGEGGGLLGSSSGKVVLTAVAINAANFLFKCFAWVYTGSHSMFAECIHSLADTINQLILAYGIHKSTQIADSDHPYGYSNMRYVSSLISGVGIFCVGTGLSFYHGIQGLMDPQPIGDFYWAFWILGGSLVSEGATLLVAINSVKQGAKSMNMSFRQYGK